MLAFLAEKLVLFNGKKTQCNYSCHWMLSMCKVHHNQFISHIPENANYSMLTNVIFYIKFAHKN